jgi:hypothetical protein
MLSLVAGDALFGLTVFIETLAALSILRAVKHVHLPEGLDPILAFYQKNLRPAVADFVPGAGAGWFDDAYVIAFALFFLFFIAQARRAMAPHPVPFDSLAPNRRTIAEIAFDWALPPILCLVGAALASLALLPLLTVPAALWLLCRRLLGRRPSNFALSPLYYVNLLASAGATAAIVGLSR